MTKLCKYEYQTEVCKDYVRTFATRCIPNRDVNLYEVRARLTKSQRTNVYYVLGRNITEARARFKSLLPYMEVLLTELIPPGAEAEEILTNPLKFPI